MQDETVVAQFTQQAESFNASAVANAAETLDALLVLGAPSESEDWLELACGPGVLSRHFAPHAGAVHGIDMTPAMVDVARREAAAAGLTNATFEVGDATATALPDASFDGAVARYALHHIPLPGRVFSEFARVLRPGGRAVLAEPIADPDADSLAWSQEVERLRDPSHWASLSLERLRTLAQGSGLRIEQDRCVSIELDFDDWLVRGSGGAAAGTLVEAALAERPQGTDCFRVIEREDRRILGLWVWLARLAR